jgi:methylphosphotriester-DNA--protein-cysteine methyltransferase
MRKRSAIVIFLFCLLAVSLLPEPIVEEHDLQETQYSAAFNLLSPQALAKTTTVYVTRTGKKYHKESCRHLKRSKKAISLKNAKAQGYTPCKVCRPPK